MEINHYSFLFDADYPMEGSYGFIYKRAFFESIFACDNNSKTLVLVGDVLLHNVCMRIKYIETKPSSSGATYKFDKDLFATLVWDLVEAISLQWNTTDDEYLPFIIASHNIYCVSCPTMHQSTAEMIDNKLKNCPGYLGAIHVDLGNPVQKYVFSTALCKDIFIDNKRIVLKRDYFADEEPEDILGIDELTQDIALDGISSINIDEFEQVQGYFTESEISNRGKVTKNILESKGRPSHKEKVAQIIYRGFVSNSKTSSFKFSTELSNNLNEACVPQEKLTGYLLNCLHPKGKDKALLFNNLLDITDSDWQFLAAQFVNGLGKAELREVRRSEFGVQYHADIQVIGRNGRTKSVRTAWIITDDGPARFVTAFLTSKEQQIDEPGNQPPVLQKNICAEEKWQALYDLARGAGNNAAEKAIPTPMVIESGMSRQIISDGVCGGAYVVVPDARRGFACWLRQSGIGYPFTTGSGQVVYAETKCQSMERAKAYSEAFSMVLKLNGIQSEVVTYLS